jgi:hypothetical protein
MTVFVADDKSTGPGLPPTTSRSWCHGRINSIQKGPPNPTPCLHTSLAEKLTVRPPGDNCPQSTVDDHLVLTHQYWFRIGMVGIGVESEAAINVLRLMGRTNNILATKQLV